MCRVLNERAQLFSSSVDVFSRRVTQDLDVSSCSCKSPFVIEKNARRPRKASGLKCVKEPAEGISSGNYNTGVDSVQADVL